MIPFTIEQMIECCYSKEKQLKEYEYLMSCVHQKKLDEIEKLCEKELPAMSSFESMCMITGPYIASLLCKINNAQQPLWYDTTLKYYGIDQDVMMDEMVLQVINESLIRFYEVTLHTIEGQKVIQKLKEMYPDCMLNDVEILDFIFQNL